MLPVEVFFNIMNMCDTVYDAWCLKLTCRNAVIAHRMFVADTFNNRTNFYVSHRSIRHWPSGCKNMKTDIVRRTDISDPRIGVRIRKRCDAGDDPLLCYMFEERYFDWLGRGLSERDVVPKKKRRLYGCEVIADNGITIGTDYRAYKIHINATTGGTYWEFLEVRPNKTRTIEINKPIS